MSLEVTGGPIIAFSFNCLEITSESVLENMDY
jgi:hypothetical protein